MTNPRFNRANPSGTHVGVPQDFMGADVPEGRPAHCDFADGRPIRVLAFMEAASVTGPAKNLIEFAVHAGELARNVARIELSIATFQRRGKTGRNLFVCGARDAGIDVDVIPERFVFDPLVIRQIRQLIATRQPDIIQTHNVKSHFLLRFTGMHRYCRWIAFHHGYTQVDLKDRMYSQLDRWSLPAADHVVTVCNAFARELQKLGVLAENITVRHNSVKPFCATPPNQVAEIRRALGIAPDTLVLMAAGRLSREKGHIDLIDAVALLRRNDPRRRFRLLIAGEGPERLRLENRVRQLGVRDSVLLIGHQPDLRSYYTMADMMILPSHSEGSPNVLLEAMAAGLPVVAAKVGGVPDIACDGSTALLVGEKDIEAMSRAIASLLDQPELRARIGEEARQASRNYRVEDYCTSLVQLYARLLAQGRLP